MSPAYDIDAWLRCLPQTLPSATTTTTNDSAPKTVCNRALDTSPRRHGRGLSVSDDESKNKSRNKRRRLDMPSPPPTVRGLSAGGHAADDNLSIRTHDESSISTKRKHADEDNVQGAGGEDEDEDEDKEDDTGRADLTTPRAPRQSQGAGHHTSASATGSPCKRSRASATDLSSASSVSGSSIVSGESGRSRKSQSPQKQATILNIFSDNPIRHNELHELMELESLPSDLEQLLGLLLTVQEGRSVLSNLDRLELSAKIRGSALSKRWLDDARHFDDGRPQYGPTPPPQQVQKLVGRAGDCWKRNCEEAVWNLEVHQSVLCMALRPDHDVGNGDDNDDLDHLVRFTGCTTAPILPDYTDQDSEVKVNLKVDFCIFVNPTKDTSAPMQPTIQALQRRLPGASVNHSSSFSLKGFPLAVCIETKRSEAGRLSAVNQLGVWQRSHFAFLRRLRDEARRLATSAGQTLPPRLDALPRWLPGLVVLGHTWHFVPATMDDGPRGVTTWFGTEAFGGTTSVLETYKVVLALQVVRAWVEETFWPWLRELMVHIQQLSDKMATSSQSQGGAG